VTALPPVEEGATHEIVACESPNAPSTSVGTPGTVAGTIASEAAEAAPVPALFVAETVNV